MRIPRFVTPIIVIIAAATVLTGCQFGGKTTESDTGTLVVLDQSDSLFKRQYLPHIMNAYPELDVQVVPYEAYMNEQNSDVTRQEALHQLLEQYNPDIIIARNDQSYRELIEDNRLRALDGFIQEEKPDLDLAVQELLDPIKGSDGLMYALASHFSGNVLYYNKNIFEKAGVPLPTEGMTWEQVLRLAERIPTKDEEGDARYGFANALVGSPYFMILGIGASEGISYVDQTGENVTVHTPEWKRIWEMVLVPMTEDHLFATRQGEPNGPPLTLFTEGKIAMMYGDETILSHAVDDHVAWGTVSAPVSSRSPDQGAGLHYLAYYGVHSKGGKPDLAWEIIKRLNGEEIAGANLGRGIPLRKNLAAQQFKGIDLMPFYRLASYPAFGGTRLPRNITSDFFMKFSMEGERKAAAVLSGELTIDEALKQLEDAGQVLLEENPAK